MMDVSQYRLLRTKIGGHVVSFEAAPWENYSTATSTLLHQITNQNYKVGDNNLFCRQRKAVCSCQMFRICLKLALLLRGLQESFNPLTTVLEARDENEFTLQLIEVKLRNEATKQRKRSSSDEQVSRRRAAEQQIWRKDKTKAKVIKRALKLLSYPARENDSISFTFMVRSGTLDFSARVIDTDDSSSYSHFTASLRKAPFATSHLVKKRISYIAKATSILGWQVWPCCHWICFSLIQERLQIRPRWR